MSDRDVRVVKQLITVVLDLKRWRVDPEAFQSIQLDISMIFYLGKLSSASCYIICNAIRTLGQMAITHLNNSNTHRVNKT